jgi:hypothetical protein
LQLVESSSTVERPVRRVDVLGGLIHEYQRTAQQSNDDRRPAMSEHGRRRLSRPQGHRRQHYLTSGADPRLAYRGQNAAGPRGNARRAHRNRELKPFTSANADPAAMTLARIDMRPLPPLPPALMGQGHEAVISRFTVTHLNQPPQRRHEPLPRQYVPVLDP